MASQLEITRNKAPHVPVGVIWGPRAVPPRTRAKIDPHPMLVFQKPPKHVNHYIPITYPIKNKKSAYSFILQIIKKGKERAGALRTGMAIPLKLNEFRNLVFFTGQSGIM
ncbi:MAG: hypothetical protein ACI8V2_002020 [Candidatus Latescibacterota bacterium]